MIHLASITIFPIKSLPGVAMHAATVLEAGGLQQDRLWAICDEEGKYVNGKRTALVHALQVHYSPDLGQATLAIRERDLARTFDLHNDQAALENWLSAYFGFRVLVKENRQGGFPDDVDAPGPTVLSLGTLAAVASWFPPMSVAEAQQRFRPNLVLEGTEPFWEDRLYGEPGQLVRFQIGEVVFQGVNPCQRCVVPTRHPDTAAVIPDFSKVFVRQRQETLPQWANRTRFNHYYRLAINTRLLPGQGGKTLRVGDEVRVWEG